MYDNITFMARPAELGGASVGGKRVGAGRPKLGPTSKMRSMRLTNDEYDFVRWAVKQYRADAESIDVQMFKRKKHKEVFEDEKFKG